MFNEECLYKNMLTPSVMYSRPFRLLFSTFAIRHMSFIVRVLHNKVLFVDFSICQLCILSLKNDNRLSDTQAKRVGVKQII